MVSEETFFAISQRYHRCPDEFIDTMTIEELNYYGDLAEESLSKMSTLPEENLLRLSRMTLNRINNDWIFIQSILSPETNNREGAKK